VIKRIAFVLVLVGVASIAVGCSKPSRETALQQEMSRLWVECESKADKNDLSCLEMRQLHRENPGVVNPAAEENAKKLIRKTDLLLLENKETMKKIDTALEGVCREPSEPVDDRPICP
jgi:hypothetical protein